MSGVFLGRSGRAKTSKRLQPTFFPPLRRGSGPGGWRRRTPSATLGPGCSYGASAVNVSKHERRGRPLVPLSQRGGLKGEWGQRVIVSGTVSLVVTSAFVVAQIPKAEPGGLTTTVTKKQEQREAGKALQKAEARPPPAVAKPAACPLNARVRVLRPANALDNQVQQYLRQARPIVRAELIFRPKRYVISTWRHFRRINRDLEAAFKEVAKTFVEAQQQGRAPRDQDGVRSPLVVDGTHAFLHEGFASVMKKRP